MVEMWLNNLHRSGVPTHCVCTQQNFDNQFQSLEHSFVPLLPHVITQMMFWISFCCKYINQISTATGSTHEKATRSIMQTVLSIIDDNLKQCNKLTNEKVCAYTQLETFMLV